MSKSNLIRDHICVYFQNGQLVATIPFEEKNIVGFDFDSRENLYVVLDDFRVFKVKIFAGEINQIQLDEAEGRLEKVKFHSTGFYGITKEGCIIEVNDFKEPTVVKVGSIANYFPEAVPEDFLLIPASMSSSGEREYLVTHPNNGLIIVQEGQEPTEFNNKTISDERKYDVNVFDKIKSIVLSPTINTLGLYDEKGNIYVLDTSLSANDIDKSETEKPTDGNYQLIWCAASCLVLRVNLSIYLLGPEGKTHAYSLTENRNTNVFIFPEIDGARIFTSKKVKFLLKVDDDTYNAMSEISTEPQRILLVAYAVTD